MDKGTDDGVLRSGRFNPSKTERVTTLTEGRVAGWLILLLAVVLSVTVTEDMRAQKQGDPLLVDETWTEDFESGTISGWFSYPLFEDTAFDFTIVPGSWHPRNHLQGYLESGNYTYPVDLAPPDDKDGHYLLRTYRPNSAGQQQIGVGYKKVLWAHSSTTLQFDYWLRYPVEAESSLRIDLAGMDGRRYQAVISETDQVRWQRAGIDLNRFRAEDGTPFNTDIGIEAVAIILELDRGAPSEHVFVAVDNVRFDGQRQAGFDLLNPKAKAAKHWRLQFAERHVRPGESFAPEVQAEQDLEQVRVTLLAPNGESLISSQNLTESRGNRWILEDPATLPSEALGPLTLVVEGVDDQGQMARSDVRLWHLEEPGQERPRVLITESDRERLRSQIASEDRFAETWKRIRDRAAEAREDPFPVQVPFSVYDQDDLFGTIGDWFSVMRQNRTGLIFDNALVWYLDGDEEARDFAIESMLRMASWDQWIHPWFTGQGRTSYYPLGRAVTFLGLSYDLLYHELSGEQRKNIRQGVMKNGIIPTWKEYFEHDRIPNNTSNWISMAAGGSFVGLMAFYDDLEEDGWSADAEPWFSGLAEKTMEVAHQTMRSDGGYGEGIGYQYVTLGNSQDMMAALKHMFGVRSGLMDVLDYDKAHIYWLYVTLDRTHGGLTMGDNSPERWGLDGFSWIARESDDPVLKWFYAQRPGISWRSLIWDETDAHLQGEAPEHHLPDSRVFPKKGSVVFRTGWQNEDAVFVYRAGPNYNHTHFDQGGFRFFALGEELITESGRASYYSDPYYWSHFIQASGHSTVLVDGFPESQRAGDFDNEISAFNKYAHITDALVSESGGFVVSELSPVYYADLDKLTRRVWFTNPGYVIVEDDIVSSGEAHTYQAQYYPPDLGALEIHNDREATVRGENATMRIRVLSPDDSHLVAKRYPIANRNITAEAPLPPRGALQVTHREPEREQRFRVVLAPEKEGSDMPVTITETSGRGYEGVEFAFDDGRIDRFYFATGEIDDGFETDARSAFISVDEDGELRAVTLEGATHFSYEDRFEFSAEMPAHVAINYGPEGSEMLNLSAPVDSEAIQANISTNRRGTVTATEGDFGASRMETSRTTRDGTVISVSLSGGPLDIVIQ